MGLLLDKNKVKKVLKDFYTITNLRIGIFDLSFNEILSFPAGHCRFCTLTRDSEQGILLCRACDHDAKNHVLQNNSTYVYQCHAGLTEVIAPITGYNELLGYIMIGQMRDIDDSINPPKRTAHVAKELNIDYTTLATAWYECTGLTKDKIMAATRIMQICSSYILTEDLIRAERETVANRVLRYIDENFNQQITLEDVCRDLAIGKTKLCSSIRTELNTTFSELLRRKRIEVSKNYLLTTNYRINEISEFVGLSDYNYFTKVFKKETGITPQEFRLKGFVD